MSDRKQDHIDLALSLGDFFYDVRFDYEPLLSGHPNILDSESLLGTTFVGKKVKSPLWISSMTGGTERAYTINAHLAEACHEFGLGMGLGSCRPLLTSNARLRDFDWRDRIGPDLPFWANLGIAQIEKFLEKGKVSEVSSLVKTLKADGLIIHINPLQEWLQEEGDLIGHPPIETVKAFLSEFPFPVVIKEVGQGMGPASLKEFLKLVSLNLNRNIVGLEFGGFGGTNFSAIELARQENQENKDKAFFGDLSPLIHVGNRAEDMIEVINAIPRDDNSKSRCDFIISGGVRNFLDGHYLMSKMGQENCLYGQGKAILERAMVSYEELQSYLRHQIKGLVFARRFLFLKNL